MLKLKVIFFKTSFFFWAMVFESYTENWRFFLNFGLNLAIEFSPKKKTLDFLAL
jgi:hypothetical protein